MTTKRLSLLILAAWAGAALLLTLTGAIAHTPRPAMLAIILGPVLAFFLASRRPGLARDVLHNLDLRLAISLHLLRAPIGVGFLVAARDGTLPAELALPAGWGDLLVGLLGVGALLAYPRWRKLVWGWNLLALADIVMVIGLAQRVVIFGEPGPGFFRFPFPMLPLFVVPLVLITHGIVWKRVLAPTAARA